MPVCPISTEAAAYRATLAARRQGTTACLALNRAEPGQRQPLERFRLVRRRRASARRSAGLKAGRYVDVKNALAAVNAQFPAVGQHHPLEPDDLLAVRELVADARDHVARPDGRLGPAVRLHAVDGRATD